MPATRKAASTKAEPAKTKTPAKAATRSAAAVSTAKRATVAAKPKAAPAAGNSRTLTIDPDQRRNYVEVAAYYIAERRGFANGDQTMDWLAAEEEIDRLLRENKLGLS